jgi:hypothetical protein
MLHEVVAAFPRMVFYFLCKEVAMIFQMQMSYHKTSPGLRFFLAGSL